MNTDWLGRVLEGAVLVTMLGCYWRFGRLIARSDETNAMLRKLAAEARSEMPTTPPAETPDSEPTKP